MEGVQALLAAQAADAIVGFLHRMHRQDQSVPLRVSRDYEYYSDFNAFVDDVNDQVRIFGLIYRPSEVLFALDGEAYRNYLVEYESDAFKKLNDMMESSEDTP